MYSDISWEAINNVKFLMYCLRPSRGIMNMKILNSEMLLAAKVSKYGLHACIKRGAGVETKHLLSTLK